MSQYDELMEEERSVLSLEAEEEARGADESGPGGETYEIAPEHRRRGTALCLSGGGYRAVLFHLGGLRRLNELGVLSHVTTISSVSGGSIVNAHIATAIARRKIAWPSSGEMIDRWDQEITEPLVRLCTNNIRTPAIGNRLRPDNWFDTAAGVKGLEAQYGDHLTDLELRQLPRRPRFIISATDTVFGVNWVFDSGRNRAGDYQAGYTRELPAWPLARAVAASSCFPPIFNPLPVGLAATDLLDGRYEDPTRDALTSETRDALVADIRLSDGGVYDNMGLEPVWKTRKNVLVSDGGAPFNPGRDKGLIWRLNRYASIGSNQAEAVRKRWLIQAYKDNEYGGAFWGISSAPSSYAETLPGYSKLLARHRIAEIRTDLDSFSSLEAEVLMTHGYFLANAASRIHMDELITRHTEPQPPRPIPSDEEKLFRDLQDSSRISVLGRGWPR